MQKNNKKMAEPPDFNKQREEECSLAKRLNTSYEEKRKKVVCHDDRDTSIDRNYAHYDIDQPELIEKVSDRSFS